MNRLQGSPIQRKRSPRAGPFDHRDARPAPTRSNVALDDEPSKLADTPSAPGFIALLKAFRRTGGTAPGDIFGPVLAQHRCDGAPSLQSHIDRGDVFGFEWGNGFWIPLFQFDADDLSISASAREVRAALPASWSGWRVAAWFARPDAFLDGRSPVDMLDDCVADVVRAAQSARLQPRIAQAAGSSARPTTDAPRHCHP